MKRVNFGRQLHVMTMLLLYVLGGFCTISAESFATRVNASADDAKVYGSNMETGSSDALVGYTGYYYCDFLARFDSIMVPQGANVDSAFMVMRASSSQSGTVCSATVCAEDTSTAGAFSTYTDYANRIIGNSLIEWQDLPALASGDWIQSPDIGAIVAEVFARPDWSEGNALAIFIRDNSSSSGAVRRFSQYDANSDFACSLLVYYSTSPMEQEMPLRRRRVVR